MEKDEPLILIVDDSATMRLITNDALNNAGFKLIEAEHGEMALEILKTTKPDAILLDVEMPGLNGFEVCTAIRKLPEHRYTPIMMVTGLEDYESINKAYLAGATDFTTKPINSSLIGYRVRYMLRTSAYFQELQTAQKKVSVLNNELIDKLLEIQQNAVAMARFVPQDFLKVLNREHIADIKLGDCVEKNISILFLDIRSFTTISEQSTPVEIFKLLNILMSYLDPIIVKNSGFIDKYIGDAIMALFTDPDQALQAALEMLGALDEFNKERMRGNLTPLGVGIGINTGTMAVGTVGFEGRMDCTVISDAVNIASRVESLTKNFNVEILISEATYEQLKHRENYHLRSLGLTSVKGKSRPIIVYEVFSHNSPADIQIKKDSATLFSAALTHYEQKRFLDAATLFSEIIANNPRDTAAAHFLQKCPSYKASSN